ncbi:amine oxidase catalytic domain-containing protein [Peniophora sp. CONT]|nr:amine oxidase catalytic domain-containing protein [Peniophora sp. CONT]
MAGGYELLKNDEQQLAPAPRRGLSSRRIAVSGALILSAVVLSVFYAFPPYGTPAELAAAGYSDSTGLFAEDGSSVQQCSANTPLPAKPPAPVNIWAPLTVPETTEIYDWMHDPARGFNLTHIKTAALSDNVLYHIEAFRPTKADALAYLAEPIEDNLPARYARVNIQHGVTPAIRDYLVGPLPISANTSVVPLTDHSHLPGDEIPFNARGFLGVGELRPLLEQICTPEFAVVTQDLLGGIALGHDNDTLMAGMNAPMSFDGTFRRAWLSWKRNVPAPWLHPVAFWQYVDISGTDPSQWKILKVVYNRQIYASIPEFMEAFHNGTLKRLPPRPEHDDPSWSTRKPPSMAKKERDLDWLPGPRSVSFAGLRFRVDFATQYISWMGWGMYFGFDRDMGLSLWDIRFRGERIIYELAPQEAMAQYAGDDPMQATTAWLDRFFGMGAAVRDMIPGYDCPDEAIYLPATTFTLEGSIKRSRAICVFESDTHKPITRHTGFHQDEMGAVKGFVLTVRSIATVGNYDYLFDYMFHIDGTIEVRLSASGYLQGGFWEKRQEGYGAPIQATSMGSLHDHVINYKVDLDVVGEANSLLATTTAVEEVEHPWLDEDWGRTVVQQKISRNYIETEDDALLFYPKNFQGGYSIVNKDEKNKWGISRGYAVHPGYSPIHNTVVGSKRLLNNANWARYNLAVSARKENERTSSSMYNMHLPGTPPVDFHKFFDGDSLTQTDLVAWINVGTHHLPQAEDSPNTRTNVATSSFMLTPLNYFDADVSMESRNAIVLNGPLTPGSPYTFDDYGVKPAHCLPQPVPAFEYSGLTAFGLDGKKAPPAEQEELRKQAELFHRIKIEI